MITTILWDIDGTLIDTTSLIVSALNHVYQKYNHQSVPEAEIRAIIGTPLSSQVQYLGDPSDFGTTIEEMESEFIHYYESNRDQERIIHEITALLILGKNSEKNTALITSKNLAEIANTLPRLGILQYVDLIVSADDVKTPKPDPEGVLKAVAHFNAEPSQTIFIGDTVHDIRAGKSGGIVACGVTWGAGIAAKLLDVGADFVVSTSGDLSDILGLS